MPSDDTRRTAPIAQEGQGSDRAASPRTWVEFRGHHFELGESALVIGRSAACQIVLDDALVSRRHAQLRMVDDAAMVEDLGSVNGVFLNGERIKGRAPIVPGDRVLVGKDEMFVRASPALTATHDARPRFTAETLSGAESLQMIASLESREEGTHQVDSLELLGGVADKVLALGRGAEAERILGAFLGNFLIGARTRGADQQTAERAVGFAIKLAVATGKGSWVDYAISVFRALCRPLPAAVVDELYTVLRNVSALNLGDFRAYLAELRANQEKFGPAERFLVQRLEGLERLAAAK